LGSFSDVDFVAPAFLTITDTQIGGNTTAGRTPKERRWRSSSTRRSRGRGSSRTWPRRLGTAHRRRAASASPNATLGSAYVDGAILNQGHLTLTDGLIAYNRSSATGSPHALVEGAGLTNSGTFSVTVFRPLPGTADLVRTIVTGNGASAQGPGSEVRGGGIANADQNLAIPNRPPSLSLTGSAVLANSAVASQAGGGIDNFVNAVLQHPPRAVGGTVVLSGSVIAGNQPDNCEPFGAIGGCLG